MKYIKPDKIHHCNNYKNISVLCQLTTANNAKKISLNIDSIIKTQRKSVSTQSSLPQDSPNTSTIYRNDYHQKTVSNQHALIPNMCQYSNRVFDKNPKYKTEMCKNIEQRGICKWGDQCFFAHGKKELQSKVPYNHYYKTKVCKHYNSTGFCPYAFRCQYFHIKSYQVFNELLECFEKKVFVKLMEENNPLGYILEDIERVQKRLPIFKSLATGYERLSFQEKCLESISN